MIQLLIISLAYHKKITIQTSLCILSIDCPPRLHHLTPRLPNVTNYGIFFKMNLFHSFGMKHCEISLKYCPMKSKQKQKCHRLTPTSI